MTDWTGNNAGQRRKVGPFMMRVAKESYPTDWCWSIMVRDTLIAGDYGLASMDEAKVVVTARLRLIARDVMDGCD